MVLFHMGIVPAADFLKLFRSIGWHGLAQKRTFGTKWVGIASNLDFFIRIDAPRSRDLENRGFGKQIMIFHGKSVFFLACWGRLPN